MTVAAAIGLWPAMTSNPNILVGSPATSADGQSWFTDLGKGPDLGSGNLSFDKSLSTRTAA